MAAKNRHSKVRNSISSKPRREVSLQSRSTKKFIADSHDNDNVFFRWLNQQPPWIVQSGVVFTTAIILRLLHFWAMSKTVIYDVLICDAWQYDRWAQEIAGGQWIGKEVFYQTPLYPYLLAVIYAIGGHSVWLARFVQAALGSIACVLVARAGTRFFDSRVGWLAGLILAAYPPGIFFDGILQKATLDLLLTSAIVWTISIMAARSNLWQTLLLGCLLGLLILNRENAWVFFPVILVWIAWQKRSVLLKLEGIGSIAALLFGMSIALGPVGLRNYYVGGEFLLTTSQMGPNFYIGNHSGATGRYVPLRQDRGDPRFERTDARILAEKAVGRSLTPREVSSYWMRRSAEDILSDPMSWLKLLARKWFLTWNQVEMVDGEGIRVHSWYSPVLLACRWILNFGVLSAMAVSGAWLARKRVRELWVLYAMTLAFAAAVTIFYVFARYRYPLVPMVTLFAAFGLAEGWKFLADSWRADWTEKLIAVLLGGLTAIGTCWPNRALHSDEVTFFSVGTALNDLGRCEEAIEQLEKAVRLKPDFAQAYVNLGTTAMKMKQWDKAKSYLSQAITLSPSNPVAFQNMANVLLEKGDKEGAEHLYRQVIEMDPFMIPALQSLSRLLVERGQTSEAVTYMQQAVEADRQSPQAYAELGTTLVADKQYRAAAEAFEMALKLNPRNILVANNYAWLLATGPDDVRNGARAVELAEQVCKEVEYETPEFVDTLAAAYAELGQFDRAVEYASKALKLVTDSDLLESKQQIQERLRFYQHGQCFRDPSTRE